MTEKFICGVCRKEGIQAWPSLKLCSSCFNLYDAALPKTIVSSSGHSANATYYHEERTDEKAKQAWLEHLKKNGFVRRGRKWTRTQEKQRKEGKGGDKR